MPCVQIGGAIVCIPGAHKEVSRETLGVKWCFSCRGRHEFFHVMSAPIVPDWYGPRVWVECGKCRADDGDCFPGTMREWDL